MEFNQDTFLRNVEISLKYVSNCNSYPGKVSLKIHQKYEGDVGCVVWDAALVLLKYLFTKNGNKYINGKHVLELGSGTGIVGIGSVVAGAQYVVITDLPEHMSLMKLNIKENEQVLNNCVSNNINAQVLHWGNKKELDYALDTDKFSAGSKKLPVCVLIADCIYYKDGMLKLYETILMIMNNALSGSCILCSYEYRHTKDKLELLKSFISLLKSSNILLLSFIDQSEMDEEFRCDDIDILLITKK